MSSPLDDMYRDIIMDHYRSPRGKQPVEKADIKSDGSNPACGDELEMQVDVTDGALKRRIAELVRRMLKGEDIELPDDLGDIDALKGVRQFPVRIKCALLSWVTLIEGLENYEKGQGVGEKPATTEGKE